MRAKLVGGLLVGMVAASAASAQTTTNAPINPARLAAARDVMIATHVDETMAKSVNQMIDPMFDAMRKQMLAQSDDGDPNYGERVRRTSVVIKSELSAMMNEMQPQIINMIVNIYARNYTVDEMHAIAGFYRSPVGQSFLAKTPMVMRDLGQSMATTLMPQMAKRTDALKAKLAAAIADLPPPKK